MRISQRARVVAEKTLDAYSADRYESWASVAALLLSRGMTEREAEAIMRSKWVRWAAERAKNPDRARSTDVARLIDLRGPRTMFTNDADFRRQLDELVAETFA